MFEVVLDFDRYSGRIKQERSDLCSTIKRQPGDTESAETDGGKEERFLYFSVSLRALRVSGLHSSHPMKIAAFLNLVRSTGQSCGVPQAMGETPMPRALADWRGFF
jgi:hypothetical protein